MCRLFHPQCMLRNSLMSITECTLHEPAKSKSIKDKIEIEAPRKLYRLQRRKNIFLIYKSISTPINSSQEMATFKLNYKTSLSNI